MDVLAPVPRDLDDLCGAGRVGGVDVDDADVERAALERCSFQQLHDRPDRVVPAQVMVQPQLVQSLASVPVEELDPGRAGTGHFRLAAVHERPKIVNQK